MRRREGWHGRIACIWVVPRPSVEGWEKGLAALEAHSPAIEEDSAMEGGGTPEGESAVAYLDARGIAPRYGSEEAWGRAVLAEMRLYVGDGARLGLAGSKFAAWVAAHTAAAEAGYQIVTQSDRSFLASLPVTALGTALTSTPLSSTPCAAHMSLSREAQRRLLLLGLRTVGQFAALRESAVAEQFGPESVIAHRWARGLDDRPVVGRRRQMVKARHEFEVPEARREALVEAAMRLTERAMRDLPPPREAWAIKRLQLEARFGDGTVQRHATWLGSAPGPETVRVLWGNLVDRLAGATAGVATAGVAAIGVRLVGLEPTGGKQLDLFVHTRTRLQLEQTLLLLAKKHSPACVVRVNLVDAREPLMARRYGFREYRP